MNKNQIFLHHTAGTAPWMLACLVGISLPWLCQSALSQEAALPPTQTSATLAPGVDVPPPESVQADISEIDLDAIVRVEVDTKQPNYRVPWNIGGMGSGSGTGFLIGKNRFLTNAHVISNNRLIYIKKISDPRPFKARVVFVADDCDLALLELESADEYETSFKTVEPLYLGGIPKLNTTVIAVGYPIGGDRISVTRGVVSRIDFLSYSHSGVDNHLTIQVDAAINPGNSGGPVLQSNQVVGVAFQGYSGSVAQNTGYMIPVPVVKRFLKDVEDGSYDYYVDMATSTIAILNPAQRQALGLLNNGVGVMVSEPDAAGSAGGILKTKDVLLSIDGHTIASDGFIEIDGERIDLNEIIERKFAGDMVALEVWRNNEKIDLEVKLKRFIPYLIQANQYNQQPQFVLFAGLQFQPIDRAVMAAHEIKDLDANYYYRYFSSDAVYRERPQVIALTAVLPDSINTHLKTYAGKVVDTINGKKIRLLQDVHDAFHNESAEKGKENFHVIRLVGEGRPLVLKREDSQIAHDRIRAKYNVGFDHHIEIPEILKIGDLINPSPDADSDKTTIPKAESTGTAKNQDSPITKLAPSLTPNDLLAGASITNQIQFEPGSSRLPEASKKQLDEIAQRFKDNRMKLQINSYTDNSGTADANLKLSTARAKTVADYLAEKGIEPARLGYKGFGAASPIDSNDTESGKQRNRRIEMIVSEE